jgi:hypothetical protein
MRYTWVLTAAALLAPSAAQAADPPITFQTQPLDQVLNDLRSAADLVGGERAVKSVNKSIKDTFGEKGFEGLDIARPLVGYVILAPKPQDITAVVVLPVTGEKEFLALCDRANSRKHKDLGKGLYELPPLDPRYKARVRFADQYAYLAYGFNPEPALDPKALVPAGKLFDPAERGVVAAKFHFDRLTPEVKKAMPTLLAEVKKEMGFDGTGFSPFGFFGFGRQEAKVFEAAGADIEKMFARYGLLLLGGADTAAVRVSVDVATADLVVEATLTPKPDTPLAQEIAARKPTGNRFAGLLAPDTAAGFKTRLPFYNDELKAAGTKFLEELQKQMRPGANEKDFVDELIKGLVRTVKTGEVDLVAGVRGPDKAGEFTFVGAFAFEDTAALEKEFKKFVQKDAPPDEQDRFKWDADKAGKVNIHTYKFANGGFLNPSKVFGGDKCALAFAFAPRGVFVALGPDPVAVTKDALTVKPAEADVLDVVLNPARTSKLVEKGGGRALDVERVLGREDKLVSATSLRITGGKELGVRFALNLRMLPRGLAVDSIEVEEKDLPNPKK